MKTSASLPRWSLQDLPFKDPAAVEADIIIEFVLVNLTFFMRFFAII
jgi:hypothetical protein